MYEKLRRFILKPIYKLLIIRVFLLAEHRLKWYNSVPTTLALKVETTHGEFIFNFKKDARVSGPRNKEKFFNTFMLGLSVPQDTVLAIPELSDIIIVAVKIRVIRVDYVILAEVLTDIYLDKFLEYVKKS